MPLRKPSSRRKPTSLAELHRIRALHLAIADLTASEIEKIKESRKHNEPPTGAVVKFAKWISEKNPTGYIYAAINIGEGKWVTTRNNRYKQEEKGYLTWTELMDYVNFDAAWVVKDDETCWELL